MSTDNVVTALVSAAKELPTDTLAGLVANAVAEAKTDRKREFYQRLLDELHAFDKLVDAFDQQHISVLPAPVHHRRVGPGKCACGFDTHTLGVCFPDHHQMLIDHMYDMYRARRR